jgi:sulfur carrier protein ThiS
MKVKVKLYGILREKLPRETKGQSELDLPPQSTLQDLLDTLHITTMVKASVNDELERDLQRELQEGDDVQLFRPVGGG